MSDIVIRVEDLTKRYRLGVVNSKTLHADLSRWWAMLRGKPDPLLRVHHARYMAEHGEYVWALDGVSFEVKRGEILGVIGKNGAGKSTLLKILTKITAPTYGTARIKGRVGSLLEVGTGFHPELTGRENIYLNGAILGMTRSEVTSRFDEIVEFAEIEEFIDTPVKRFSSGMYVRLAFAVAAHLDPEILLVDEVLAVGDVRFKEKCLNKMSKVSQTGRTILIVSHNMTSISSLCDRCVLLEQGKLVSDGKTNDVIKLYLSGSGEAEASVDLTQSPDRRGTGDARVVAAALRDEAGDPCRRFLMGQRLVIEFDVDFRPPGRSAMFAFTLTTLQGTRLINWVSVDSGLDAQPYSGTVRVQARIDNLPLYPGSYAVERLWVGAPSRIDCFDEVHPLLTFEVEQSHHGSDVRPLVQRMGLVQLPIDVSVGHP